MRRRLQLANSHDSRGGLSCIAGDVAYWDGSKVKTTPLSSWDTSLGTPVGIVVVPKGFAPDGKVRIVGLKPVDSNGNQSSSHVKMSWGGYVTDASLTNFTKVPTTDNNGSTSTGSSTFGYLPSDNFTGATSFVDPKAKYSETSYLIPSPYLDDAPNPEYYKTISGNNVLSDFNGLSNTQTLVGLGTGYTPADACWEYNDGASNLQWYLPAMGELGYLMPRFNEINNTIITIGGVAVASYVFWSSSEYSSTNAYYLNTTNGNVHTANKASYFYVRPFTILDDGQDSSEDSGEDNVNLITFIISSTQYQAEEGMTWGEWINSDYNTGGFSSTSGMVFHRYGAVSSSATALEEQRITCIIEPKQYYIYSVGSVN